MDIPSISAAVAAVGVLVGVTLAYLEVRTLVKQRQTDLITRLHLTWNSREYQEAWNKVLERKFTNYDEYKKKYGFVEARQIGGFFDKVGVLLYRKLADIGLVNDLFGSDVNITWEKIKPLVEQGREGQKRPDIFAHFEYLYNEMQKSEQRPLPYEMQQ